MFVVLLFAGLVGFTYACCLCVLLVFVVWWFTLVVFMFSSTCLLLVFLFGCLLVRCVYVCAGFVDYVFFGCFDCGCFGYCLSVCGLLMLVWVMLGLFSLLCLMLCYSMLLDCFAFDFGCFRLCLVCCLVCFICWFLVVCSLL